MSKILGKDFSKKIYEAIWAYHEFHTEINKYFVEGINLKPNNYEQEIYFVDYNWIKSWKKYTNYENVIGMGRDNYDFLKENGFLEYNEKPKFRNIESGSAYKIFKAKTVFKIEDFDCLIDKATYDYFREYNNHYFSPFKFLDYLDNNLDSINCIFYNDMFVLLIENENRMKVIYQKEVNLKARLFQFNLQFKEYVNKNYPPDFIKGLKDLLFSSNENIDFYHYFKEKFLKNDKKRNGLINLLTQESENEKIFIKEYECSVTNLILYKKNITNIKYDNYEFALNDLNSKRLIGLQNIGATCYMNATLQCLVNIKQLTNYLLNNNNFFSILQKMEICEVLGTYC